MMEMPLILRPHGRRQCASGSRRCAPVGHRDTIPPRQYGRQRTKLDPRMRQPWRGMQGRGGPRKEGARRRTGLPLCKRLRTMDP